MGEMDTDVLHSKVDLEKNNGLQVYKVDALMGAKWKHQSKWMMVGYITQKSGMVINLPMDKDQIILFKHQLYYSYLQATRNYFPREIMAQQW